MGTKVFDNALDLITFTRASGGTALRKISYGPELVTNGTFDTDVSGWTLTNVSGTATFTQSSGQATFVRQAFGDKVSQAITCTVGKVYEVSCDLTAVSGGTARVRFNSTNTPTGAGSVADAASSGAFSSVIVADATTMYFVFDTNANGSSVTIDNISVKEVLFDRPDGTLTLFNHPTNVPRIEYDAAGAVKGLLVEEARTNLLTYSEDFTNAAWTKGTPTATLALDAIGPDGQNNSAVTLIDNAAGGTGADVEILRTQTVSVSTTYTASIFAKAGGASRLGFYTQAFTTPTSNAGVIFDLSAGSVVNNEVGFTSTVQDFGNGWYRCSATFTTDAADTSGRIYWTVLEDTATTFPGSSNTVNLDGTSSVLIYGAQFEAGAFPTSYIPTAGATATRAADIASILVSAFGYNQQAGSVVVEAETISTAQFNHADLRIKATNGNVFSDSGSRVGSYAEGSYVVFGAITSVNMKVDSVITEGQPYKAAYAFKENDAALSVDGSSIVADIATNFSSYQAAVFDLGKGANYLNGHIKSIRYFPRRLSNAQLQELTT